MASGNPSGDGETRTRNGVGTAARFRNVLLIRPDRLQSGAGRNRTLSAAFGEQLVPMTLNPLLDTCSTLGHTRIPMPAGRLELPKSIKDRRFTDCCNCRYATPAKKGNIQLSKTAAVSAPESSSKLRIWFGFRERDPLPLDQLRLSKSIKLAR